MSLAARGGAQRSLEARARERKNKEELSRFAVLFVEQSSFFFFALDAPFRLFFFPLSSVVPLANCACAMAAIVRCPGRSEKS